MRCVDPEILVCLICTKDKGAEASEAVADADTSESGAMVVAQTSGATGASELDYKLSIVPVKSKRDLNH